MACKSCLLYTINSLESSLTFENEENKSISVSNPMEYWIKWNQMGLRWAVVNNITSLPNEFRPVLCQNQFNRTQIWLQGLKSVPIQYKHAIQNIYPWQSFFFWRPEKKITQVIYTEKLPLHSFNRWYFTNFRIHISSHLSQTHVCRSHSSWRNRRVITRR